MTESKPTEQTLATPEIKARKGISPVWILPVVALAIAGWLVYKSIVDAGIEATIRFETAQGIEQGKTRVMYRGMPVGVVKHLSINKDAQHIDVKVEFVKSARDQLRQNTKFWMVAPRISPAGVTGLETILKGNYIGMQPGDGPLTDRFIAISDPPPETCYEPGLHIKLITDDVGSLTQGSPVLYKGMQAGEIRKSTLNDRDEVVIDTFIRNQYVPLIKSSTKFFNVSGFTFEGGLSGFKVRAEGLSAMVTGAVAFFNLNSGPHSKKAEDGATFKLFDNKATAQQEGRSFTLLFDDGEGISGRTPIKYRGVEIGKVVNIDLDERTTGVRVKASIQDRYQHFLKQGTRFWLVKPKLGLAETRNLETLVTGVYITLRPGHGKPERTFKAAGSPPDSDESARGLHIVLKADRLGSLKRGDPIYYRQIKVGRVTGCRLSKDAVFAEIDANIAQQYAPLVRTDSKFWNASGISMNFGLLKGAELRTESIEAMLEGGIAFATPPKQSPSTSYGNEKIPYASASGDTPRPEAGPDSGPAGGPAKNDAAFTLHEKPKDEWLKWRTKIEWGKRH